MDPNQTFESGNMSRTSTPLDSRPLGNRSEGESVQRPTLPNSQSIGHVMQDLIRDMTVLVESEGRLLRTELSEKAAIVKASSVSMISAITLMVFGVQALVAAAVIGLSYVLDWWLAAASVGAVLLALGVGLALKSKKALNFDNLKPSKSADAFHEIGSKLKEKAHEFYH